jgi:transketolase
MAPHIKYLEDLGLMKMLPGMTVINTCDYNQTKAATKAIADYDGPVYLSALEDQK